MDHSIIIVDDDPDFIDVITQTIQSLGFKNIRGEVDPLQVVSLIEKKMASESDREGTWTSMSSSVTENR